MSGNRLLGDPVIPPAWSFDTSRDTPCPICEEKGKVVERHTDYEIGTMQETLRCRYCKHNFEERLTKFKAI
jgi:RecJ-like exonuclease